MSEENDKSIKNSVTIEKCFEKCEVNDNILTIYKRNYLKGKNDKEIIIRTFQNIVLK